MMVIWFDQVRFWVFPLSPYSVIAGHVYIFAEKSRSPGKSYHWGFESNTAKQSSQVSVLGVTLLPTTLTGGYYCNMPFNRIDV